MKQAPIPASKYNVALSGLIRPYSTRYPYIASPAAFLKIIKIYRFSYFSLPFLFLFYIINYPFRFSCAGLRPLFLASTAYRRSLYFTFI